MDYVSILTHSDYCLSMVVQSVDAALLRECTAAVPVGRLQQFLADMAESGNVFLTLSF